MDNKISPILTPLELIEKSLLAALKSIEDRLDKLIEELPPPQTITMGFSEVYKDERDKQMDRVIKQMEPHFKPGRPIMKKPGETFVEAIKRDAIERAIEENQNPNKKNKEIKECLDVIDRHFEHIGLYQKIEENQPKPKEDTMAMLEPRCGKTATGNLVERQETSENHIRELAIRVNFLEGVIDNLFQQTGVPKPDMAAPEKTL